MRSRRHCLLTTLAGCTSEVPYEPTRAIVRSIPHEQAKAGLRDLLSRARTEKEAVEVGDDGFSYRAFNSSWPVNRDRYAEIAPRAYRVKYDQRWFIDVRGDRREGEYPCLWFDREENLERCLDALESLKADALARAGKGGTP